MPLDRNPLFPLKKSSLICDWEIILKLLKTQFLDRVLNVRFKLPPTKQTHTNPPVSGDRFQGDLSCGMDVILVCLIVSFNTFLFHWKHRRQSEAGTGNMADR